MPALVQRMLAPLPYPTEPAEARSNIDAHNGQPRTFFVKAAMFPKADTISIVSVTLKTVFKRRLVDRVLHLWTEMAREGRFPRRDQIEPSVLGADWVNCLVIAVQSPVERSCFVEVGENLSVA